LFSFTAISPFIFNTHGDISPYSVAEQFKCHKIYLKHKIKHPKKHPKTGDALCLISGPLIRLSSMLKPPMIHHLNQIKASVSGPFEAIYIPLWKTITQRFGRDIYKLKAKP
jgi:hypothetical protein